MRGWAPVSAGPRCSQLNARGGPFLEALLDCAEELARHHPVDDPMVESETDIHHVSNRDPVADYDRALDDGFGGQDGRLGLIDDRLAGNRAGRACVVERERAPLNIVRLELLGASSFDQVVDRTNKLGKTKLVRVLQHWDDQAVRDLSLIHI